MADKALCNRCGRYVDLVYSSYDTPIPRLLYKMNVSVTVEAKCANCGNVLYATTEIVTLKSQQPFMDYQVEEK